MTKSHRAPSNFRTRTRVLSGCLFTLVAMVAALVATLVIRAPRPDYTGARCRFDPILGWAPALGPSAGEGPHRVGQWGEEVDDDREHIVLIGDSVAYGTGVSHEETYARLLGRMTKDYQVVNLSVTGYSIDQYYLMLARELPRLHPKLVLVNIFSGNDYQGTTTDNNYGYAKPLFVPDGEGLRLANIPLTETNCVYLFSRSLLFSFLWRWAMAEEQGYPRGGRRREAVTHLIDHLCSSKRLTEEEGRKVVERLLHRIAALAAEHGAQVGFVLLPDGGDFVDRDYRDRPWFPKLRFFQELLGSLPYPVLDLYQVLSRSALCLPNGADLYQCPLEALYLDGSHYTPFGHCVVAEALHVFIEERFGIP